MDLNSSKKCNKFNTRKLLHNELSEFIEIHKKLIPERNKKMDKYVIRTSNILNNLEQDLVKPILNKALNILKENNICNFDSTKYYVEFHQRNCGFEKSNYQWSDWHYDDYGSVNYEVYTVIFYLRKDLTVKGGNLEYKLNKKLNIHNVNVGDIVQFYGNLYHKPQPTSGFGCRDIIVVFIKRTN